MPIATISDPGYVEKQYRQVSNLNLRIGIHDRFSVNPNGWFRWVFDQLNLPPHCRILELGSGSGYLWLQNNDRIPAGWEVVLSDLSAGMMDECMLNLEKRGNFQFKVIDAQSIPFTDLCFDAVIANHMLYHVPDLPKAFLEIRRVLIPGGRFLASTIGARHFNEMADLLKKFDAGLSGWRDLAGSFTLENGAALLSAWFTEIGMARYKDALEITETGPLVDYILSGRIELSKKKQDRLREFVAHEMAARGGVIHVSKDSGLFACMRPWGLNDEN